MIYLIIFIHNKIKKQNKLQLISNILALLLALCLYYFIAFGNFNARQLNTESSNIKS